MAFLVDAHHGLKEDVEAISQGLAEVRAGKKVLVLNKIDLVPKPALLALAQTLNERAAFSATRSPRHYPAMGLAISNGGSRRMPPPGPWLYPEDQISARMPRCASFAAEITRENFICGCIKGCLPGDGRDRRLERTQRRLRAHQRADDLCRTRKSAKNSPRQGWPNHKSDRFLLLASISRPQSNSRFACSFSSRYARAPGRRS